MMPAHSGLALTSVTDFTKADNFALMQQLGSLIAKSVIRVSARLSTLAHFMGSKGQL